ncbi:thiamine pyrophosphate-dependent dehydrogenase E1 component subunit alpha [Varunaivibrio sulfuroxidans]|nr:thiamine pyrophosphate-dependent dehydrogenase E1 component subunit alpha [Varunaivibrio sulfuroxidans]
MRCPMHLCIGQEAIAVGVCASLKREDLVYSNHRAHGHYLAKGGNLNAMIAELYGRASGCCGGRGGSMHMIDMDVGFMGATPIVGGTVPLAVGTAWACALKDTGQVTVVFFGDGCFEEGVVHESLNFAALHRLPILFVCENNNFSVYTRREERQPDRPIHLLAGAHGITAYSGNGNDVQEVLNASRRAVESIRSGHGPQFLEFHTYRWREHCGPNFDDQLGYRSKQEIEAGMNDCPIANYVEKINFKNTSITQQEAEIRAEITAAFEFALSSQTPTIKDAEGKVYA